MAFTISEAKTKLIHNMIGLLFAAIHVIGTLVVHRSGCHDDRWPKGSGVDRLPFNERQKMLLPSPSYPVDLLLSMQVLFGIRGEGSIVIF
jgi:hypothetical protein